VLGRELLRRLWVRAAYIPFRPRQETGNIEDTGTSDLRVVPGGSDVAKEHDEIASL
jgi:hypothetical protein